jgi:uncharacterized phage-associated protein
MPAWFNVRKAAQVAAFFAKQRGGEIDAETLASLVYLANRLAMDRFAFPILNDNLEATDTGPVNSLMLACITGHPLDRAAWEEFVSGQNRAGIGLANRQITNADLDEVSEAEITILNETWETFGHLTTRQIRDYTQTNCPEWEPPRGGTKPITYERVFRCLGKKDSRSFAERIAARRHIDEVFAGAA